MSHIFNNPELKDLMGNIFKSINHNIKKTMDDVDNVDNVDNGDNGDNGDNVDNVDDITDTIHSNTDTTDSEDETNYKKDIDIKKKYFNKDSGDSNLIDMLLYLFLDRNGNNMADILTDLSTNIAENNQLIKTNIETRNNILLQKQPTSKQNSNNNIIELD